MPAPPRRLVAIAGIEIQFHSSWFIILALIALSLGSHFHYADPRWPEWVVAVTAAAATALFFASVVAHELAHSLVARAHGLPVKAITLFVFGGVSQLSREPGDAGAEFRIAIVGPLASLALGGVCWGLSRLGSQHNPAFAALWWIGVINLSLALFNLVPGFPLDGGRVLRAIVWSANHDFLRATRWATRIGKTFAILMILGGLLEFFQAGMEFSGLWLAFIGWFLLSAAEQSWRQVEIRDALGHYTVRDLETPFYSRVAPEASLESFINERSRDRNHRPSLVLDDRDRLLGEISAADLNRLPRGEWASTPVRRLMRPGVEAVRPEEGLNAALEKMALRQAAQLPIAADDGVVRGVIRRDRILELLHARLRG